MPRQITPAARARRALLFDLLAGLALAILFALLSAGIGIVGFAGLLVSLLLIAWIAIERGARLLLRRREHAARRPARRR